MGRKFLVMELPPTTTEDELRECLSLVGRVKTIRLIESSAQSTNLVGEVEMETEEAAEEAKKMLLEAELKVNGSWWDS